MSNRFYISDLHYDHAGILTFKRDDGTPLRPFESLDQMQATITHNWNKVVGQVDTVYVLGDVCLSKSTKALEFLGQLKGRKILIRGNHDIAKLTQYAKYFDDVRAYDKKDGIICSHIPIHPQSLARFGVNVHGHLHYQEVRRLDQGGQFVGNFGFVPSLGLVDYGPDTRYFNVSVERINYTPIEYSELKDAIAKRQAFC